MKKAVVLYSGGLDSRLAINILQDQGFEIHAVYFNLPFGCGCCDISCNFNFTQESGVKMKIIDVTKEEYLKEYLEIIKNPKYGTGSGINPCKDCKIFIFKKAKEYADKNNIKVIASGEVLGQRPMSQVSSAMKTIDQALGFEILRPLCAKLLPETSYEKEGLVDREKLFDIQGRGRKVQMKLAEEYETKYPSPGGGCFLCEKNVSNRLIQLLKRNLIKEETLILTMLGRHFIIEENWFVVARDMNESLKINEFKNCIIGNKGEPSVYYFLDSGKKIAKDLQKSYTKGSTQKNKFEEYKI